MVRKRPGICDECQAEKNPEIPILRGQIASKGRWPVTYCTECGCVIEGTPGLLDYLCKWATGTWPWQDKT